MDNNVTAVDWKRIVSLMAFISENFNLFSSIKKDYYNVVEGDLFKLRERAYSNDTYNILKFYPYQKEPHDEEKIKNLLRKINLIYFENEVLFEDENDQKNVMYLFLEKFFSNIEIFKKSEINIHENFNNELKKIKYILEEQSETKIESSQVYQLKTFLNYFRDKNSEMRINLYSTFLSIYDEFIDNLENYLRNSLLIELLFELYIPVLIKIVNCILKSKSYLIEKLKKYVMDGDFFKTDIVIDYIESVGFYSPENDLNVLLMFLNYIEEINDKVRKEFNPILINIRESLIEAKDNSIFYAEEMLE